jgi:hypothetical protein
MPVQLTLRSPKGGRVLAEREYADGYRIDATSGWLVVVDRNGSVIAAHAACPGLEGAIVEHASAAGHPRADWTPEDNAAAGVAPVDEDDEPEEDLADPRDRALRMADLRNTSEDDRFAERLVAQLQRLGNEYGPLGVAIAAATLTDPRVLVAQITDTDVRGVVLPEPVNTPPPHEACEEQADALRAEVARLSGLLDDASREADRADDATSTLATYRREVDEQTARAEREHASRLRLERLLDAQQSTTVTIRGHLDRKRARAEQAENDLLAARERDERLTAERDELRATVALYRHRYGSPLEWTVEQQPGVREGVVVDTVPHEPIDLRPVEEDPRRPHPDAWPDDAVLLTYRELRRLVSLHLERYGVEPATVRAVLEADVPLRLGEVLA